MIHSTASPLQFFLLAIWLTFVFVIMPIIIIILVWTKWVFSPFGIERISFLRKEWKVPWGDVKFIAIHPVYRQIIIIQVKKKRIGLRMGFEGIRDFERFMSLRVPRADWPPIATNWRNGKYDLIQRSDMSLQDTITYSNRPSETFSLDKGQRIFLYIVSFALPMVGVIVSFLFYKSRNPGSKRVGEICAGLTLAGFIGWLLGSDLLLDLLNSLF